MTGIQGQEWWDVSVNAVVHQLYLPPPHHLTRRHTTNITLRRTYRYGPLQCCLHSWLELVLMTGRGGQEWWDVRVDNAVVPHQLELPPPHHLTRRHTNNITLRRTYHYGPLQCCCRPWLELVAMTGREGQEWWDVRVNAVIVHQLDLPPPHHLTRRHTNNITTTPHLPPTPDAMLLSPVA